MIERLFETSKPARGTACVDQCVGDGLLKSGFADVMRARKGREHAVLREQLEGAHVQFAIAAQGVAQGSLGARKGRRIEDDQVVFALRFLGRRAEIEIRPARSS